MSRTSLDSEFVAIGNSTPISRAICITKDDGFEEKFGAVWPSGVTPGREKPEEFLPAYDITGIGSAYPPCFLRT